MRSSPSCAPEECVGTGGRCRCLLGRFRLFVLGVLMAALSAAASRLATPAVHRVALLALCSAYLQGGLTKLFNFEGAIAEMNHFGLTPAMPFAIATIVLELAAPLAILCGWYRWLGALALAGFTLMATFVANRFWELAPPQRLMTANAFFEHLGLVGALILVAWHDARGRGHPDHIMNVDDDR